MVGESRRVAGMVFRRSVLKIGTTFSKVIRKYIKNNDGKLLKQLFY